MGGLGSLTGMGVDHYTARQRHRMVYGGIVSQTSSSVLLHYAHTTLVQTPMTQLLPADIGAAAAYEVYRTWKHNSSLYAPLSADRMLQREGLIGMAMAEGIITLHTPPVSLADARISQQRDCGNILGAVWMCTASARHASRQQPPPRHSPIE